MPDLRAVANMVRVWASPALPVFPFALAGEHGGSLYIGLCSASGRPSEPALKNDDHGKAGRSADMA
jgi:hypothetical protein